MGGVGGDVCGQTYLDEETTMYWLQQRNLLNSTEI